MLFRARAPLRLGLAGGGTDLSPYCDRHGGAVLNATIDLYAYATLELRDGGDAVEFQTADTRESLHMPADQCSDAPTQPLALHRAVYRRIVRDFRRDSPLPCRLTTYCEAPPGSGLGSSSTLVVAMVKAFVEALSLPLGEYDIAHLAFQIEREDAGLLGGRQDQYAAAFGGFNFIEFYADDRVIVNPLRIKNWVTCELEASMVLFHTGVSRASAAIVAEQTRNLAAGATEPLEAMHALKADAFRMKEALLRGDTRGMAQILNATWEAKRRTAAAISNESIERLMERAFAAGATAAKVSGAGGGGFVLFMAEPERRLELMTALAHLPGQVLTCSFTERGTEGWRID
jgi:D-glycero-alpha-D-manno-heptose-7-phosphate kinase